MLVSNEELATVRDAMRGLNTMVDELTTGAREKVVLTRRGRMVGVVLSVERYEALEQAETVAYP